MRSIYNFHTAIHADFSQSLIDSPLRNTDKRADTDSCQSIYRIKITGHVYFDTQLPGLLALNGK